MAKFAILSDIHANLEALDVVLAKCAELKIDHYFSLGDIVGYNANPAECLEKVRALKPMAMVRGNHDEYVGNSDEEISGFNPHAKFAVNWTRAQLSDEQRNWLMSAKYHMMVRSCKTTLVHATLDTPENWGYIFDVAHAKNSFSYQLNQICYCGHSHVPNAFCIKPFADNPVELAAWAPCDPDSEDFSIPTEYTIEVKAGHKYLFNVGSIGQPRNRDPRASFAVFDSDKNTVTRYCIPYDIATAQQKILTAGLPERLSNRLSSGT